MKITVESNDGETFSETAEWNACVAKDAAHLWYRAMLGYGYQPESILDAMEAVLEEHREDEKGT